jgi:cellulose synthase/poly-beta-1,6-N-acetylglucosamine synthase-like glycosyltransferase
MGLLEASLWISAAWIGYALVGYPLLTVTFGSLGAARRRVRKAPIEPTISFLVSAYNEEDSIAKKVSDTLALDYPPDRLQVIVVSDGSTDRTDEIVRGFADPRVLLHRAEGRLGKTAALNGAVAVAKGDLLVFSDATGEFSPNALRALAANFADPEVGCAAGRVAYRYGRDATSEGFRGYQGIVVAIRRAENAFGDQTSVSGSIHALRRELFRPGRPGFSMDVIDAVHTVVQGRRVVYEYDAVSLEDSRTRPRDEFRARVRISVRNTTMAGYILRQLVGHRKWFYLFQMVSHKMLRWWLWVPLVVAFGSSLLLARESAVFAALAAGQAVFYAAALLGLRVGLRGLPGRALAFASFFVMGNAAMCWGTLKGLAGQQSPSWEPLR